MKRHFEQSPTHTKGFAHVSRPKHTNKKNLRLVNADKKISQNFSRGAYAARGGGRKKKKIPPNLPRLGAKTARPTGRARGRHRLAVGRSALCWPPVARRCAPFSLSPRRAVRLGAWAQCCVFGGVARPILFLLGPPFVPAHPLGSAKWGRSALVLFPWLGHFVPSTGLPLDHGSPFSHQQGALARPRQAHRPPRAKTGPSTAP